MSVLAILPPNENIWHGDEHARRYTTSEEREHARDAILINFARTVLGPSFINLDVDDAQAIWRIAVKNGFRMQTFDGHPSILVA